MWWKIFALVLGVLLAGNREMDLPEESTFGSVPYFRDDTGRDAQLVEGYLYGYWNGKLCRYDVNNDYEEQILFDAGCNQAGSFCISEGVIYFLYRPVTSTRTHENTCLYRINCDGTGLALLQEEILDVVYDRDNYLIDIYEGILYLVDPADRQRREFYCLTGERDVVRVPMKATLYGKIPEGYRETARGNLPSLVYMMRNYGYVLLEKESGEGLYLCDLNTGIINECFGEIDVYPYIMYITNDKLIFYIWNANSFAKQWYWVSLDNLNNPQKWILFDNESYRKNAFFYDESGGYFVKYDYDSECWEVWYAGWEDDTATLIRQIDKEDGLNDASPIFRGQSNMWYFDGDAFYYNENGYCTDLSRYEEDCIIRNNMEGEKEIICTYNQNANYGEKLCYYITEEKGYSISQELINELKQRFGRFYVYGEQLEFISEKAYLRGDSEGVNKINTYMQQEYERIIREWEYNQEEWEQLMLKETEEQNSEELNVLDLLVMSYEMYSYITYADDKYIVFRVCEGGYFGGAHPNYYYTNYVFDRITGERLTINDIVGKDNEEICRIIVPYMDKDYDFYEGFWYIEPEKLITEQHRLFLTEEGIGIFFNTYDIDCYAAGTIEFVIPYEAFKLPEW